MSSIQFHSPINKILDQAFNQGNLAVVDDLLSSDPLAHKALGEAPHGSDGLKRMIAIFRIAFPDLLCNVEDEIVDGDKFAVRWSIHGTHRGMFLGNPPTGRQVDVLGIIFGRIENGRIIEDWILTDQMGILQQIGIIPPSSMI